jgi:hypothetical protein
MSVPMVPQPGRVAASTVYLLYPEGLCTVVSISLYSCHDFDARVCLAGLRCRLAEMRARALQQCETTASSSRC